MHKGIPHPGLADRLKAIISCYYIAKNNNLQFKLVHKYPFEISRYLEPANVTWQCKEEDVVYKRQNTVFFTYRDKNGMPSLSPYKNYICIDYVGNDLLWQYPSHAHNFGNLFNELFNVSELIEKELLRNGLRKGEYISVHLRFVNQLEHFEKGKSSKLSSEEQSALISRCHKGIINLINTQGEDCPVVVFSDSKRFLDSLSNLPVLTLDSSNISHVSYGTSDDSVLKTFLDFFAMARSKAVYRIMAPEMYKTAFSECAAYVGGMDIKNIIV